MAFNPFDLGKGTKVRVKDNVKSPYAGRWGKLDKVDRGVYIIKFPDGKSERFLPAEIEYDV
jgi:hypothetical protein